jgi:Transposase DDE domain group 1
MKRLFVNLFLQGQATAPARIVLDLGATDDPIHGEQEGRFFHGYYQCYCSAGRISTLSPQPHALVWLGLLKTKPDVSLSER